MADTTPIPAADLPKVTPGTLDSVVGVDESTGEARRFGLSELPASTTQAAQLQTYVDAAEAARDAAMASGDIYADTAAGLAATTSGQYFSVPSADSSEYLTLYKNNAGSALEVKRYPSADAVAKPAWVGKKNGWPDPFFRTFDLTSETLLGRDRWYWNNVGGGAFNGWSRVVNTLFDGYALRRAANQGDVSLNGPSIHLDEIGASAGDTITVYALVVGDGAVVSCRAKFDNGSQLSASFIQSSDGSSDITATAAAKWVRHVVPVPAGATRLDTFAYTFTADKTFDLIALWAFKGAASAGPSWPTFPDSARADYLVGDHEARLDVIEADAVPAAAYAVDSYGQVSAATTSVALDGTDFSATPRDLTFMGWGERYTPAGVTFNALRVKLISRTAGTSAKWRTLRCVVRTGANSANSGATVVAVGSITVRERLDSLSDVTFLLKDPVTGLPKTLSDSDFSGGEYFIGVYALKADGAAAACGEPRGTMANSLAQSYYHVSSTNQPQTGGWVATTAGANKRLGFQHLLLTTPSESTAYEPTQEFARDLADVSDMPAPEMVVPPFLFGVQGREANVYFDNLHVASAGDYFHKVTASPSVGMQQNERFTWIPSVAQAAGTLTIAAHDKRSGSQLVTKTAQLRAAASSAGSGLNKKVLVVGDSLVNAGIITQTMLDIAGTDVMGVTLLGTRGAGSNKHEGRGGWTVAKYTTDFSDGTYGANPFWKSGAVNFGQYLTDNSIATPDWVFIHLGINDVFSQSDDTACSSLADGIFTSLDTLVASIKAADANVKIGLMIPSPPSADQDSFGLSEALGATRWRFKRNILIWTRQLIAKYAGQEANRIYVVPSNVALDTVNNMSRAASAPVNSRSAVTVTRQNNGVHPASEGYRQIGDALWAFLKFYA